MSKSCCNHSHAAPIKAIGKAALLAGDYSADQRMAAFLVALSRRFAQRGFSATRLHLTMTRTDIANYLRLAPETVSRVLKRLQEDKLVHVDRRELEILDPARLEALAEKAEASAAALEAAAASA